MLQNLISLYFFDQKLSLGTKNHFAQIEEKTDNFNTLYFQQAQFPYIKLDDAEIWKEPSTSPKQKLF